MIEGEYAPPFVNSTLRGLCNLSCILVQSVSKQCGLVGFVPSVCHLRDLLRKYPFAGIVSSKIVPSRAVAKLFDFDHSCELMQLMLALLCPRCGNKIV